MARPKRTTVDYYPHYVKCGRTIYILEARFGNDGYAFWFKVLEVLGENEGISMTVLFLQIGSIFLQRHGSTLRRRQK